LKTSKFDIIALVKMILLLASVFYGGCASIALSTWNEDFEADNQRSIEFASGSVPAEYLGKADDSYVYRLLDTKTKRSFSGFRQIITEAWRLNCMVIPLR